MTKQPDLFYRERYWKCGKCKSECEFKPRGVTSCCGHKTAYPYTKQQILLGRARSRELDEWRRAGVLP